MEWGNERNREGERTGELGKLEPGEGNWGNWNREERGMRGEWKHSNWGIIQTGYNRENGGMNNRGNGEWEGNENSAIREC